MSLTRSHALSIILSLDRHIERSGQVAPQYQRGGGLAAVSGIVIGTARYLIKTGAVVKPQRGVIVLVDLEKHGTRTKPGQPPQMQIEQLTRKAPSALAAGDRNRKDFSLVLDQPRHDERRKLCTSERAVRNDVPVKQQTFYLLFAP